MHPITFADFAFTDSPSVPGGCDPWMAQHWRRDNWRPYSPPSWRPETIDELNRWLRDAGAMPGIKRRQTSNGTIFRHIGWASPGESAEPAGVHDLHAQIRGIAAHYDGFRNFVVLWIRDIVRTHTPDGQRILHLRLAFEGWDGAGDQMPDMNPDTEIGNKIHDAYTGAKS